MATPSSRPTPPDGLGAALRRPSVIAFAAISAALGVLFWAVPEIDLWAAALFYRADDGFFLKNSLFAQAFYQAIPVVTPIVVGALFVMLGIAVLHRARPLGLGVASILYLMLVLALGPGLLVNSVLKDNWGRARPSQIVEFGGAKQFTPAFVIADQCSRNCSFVAGHPAMAFGFFGLALLAVHRRRRLAATTAVAVVGALAGLGRLMQGGHFLSDVVFSGIFVYAVAWLLHKLILEGEWRTHPATMRFALRAARFRHRLRAPARRVIDLSRPVSLVLIALLALGVLAFFFLDKPVALAVKRLDGTAVHRFFEAATQLGVSTGWLIGSAALFIGCWAWARRTEDEALRRRRHDWSVRGLYVFACIAIPGLITNLLKALFGRARPKLLFSDEGYGFYFLRFESDYWSFPSGHTTTAAGLAMALYLMRPKLWPLSLALVLLVASSRVVLASHFISDTVVSAFLATVLAIALRDYFAARGARIFPPNGRQD